MSGRAPGREPPNMLLGVFHLACFDAGGFVHFADTAQAFLASLAPLIAFPLVGATLILLRGDAMSAATEFLATLAALLAPAVLSHPLAVAWQREREWFRYATAFNWCQWAIPIAAVGLLLIADVLVAAGLPRRIGALVLVLGLLSYALALHWFIARNGLRLTALRAAALVVLVNFGMAVIVLGPSLLALAVQQD
jgi:hypothetical protein